ncbi:MAG: hypothetical protein J6Y43_07930 [Clostridia bacterium]|nr:hypothetical protein [Clostridia bacterium]
MYTLYTDRFLRDLDDFAAPDETDSLKVLELLYSSKSDLLGYSQDQWTNYIAMAQQEGFFTDF